MNGQAITTFPPRNQRALQWEALYFTFDGDMRCLTPDGSGHVGGNIDKPDDSYFVDLCGENVNAVHFAE